VHAIRLPEKLVLDGKLDEAIYSPGAAAGGFVQAEPNFGQPATEQTQLWVFFDDQAIYAGSSVSTPGWISGRASTCAATART
jgi:hypothetical protein